MKSKLAEYGWPRAMPAEVAAEYVGLSRSAIYTLLDSAGDFPKPVRLTERRIVWLREDLDAWLDAKAGKVKEPVMDGWET